MSQGTPPNLDVQLAHQHFSADCFNRTWSLIEKPDRTPADTEAMVLCALASLWHWTQRSDCTDRNLSIGHWQVSRTYALAVQGANAMHHARRSRALLPEGSPPFYLGYAHEAIARAAIVLGDRELFVEHLKAARQCAAEVTDARERQWLDNDLKSLESTTGPAGP
jgi:hypothetical protein